MPAPITMLSSPLGNNCYSLQMGALGRVACILLGLYPTGTRGPLLFCRQQERDWPSQVSREVQEQMAAYRAWQSSSTSKILRLLGTRKGLTCVMDPSLLLSPLGILSDQGRNLAPPMG